MGMFDKAKEMAEKGKQAAQEGAEKAKEVAEKATSAETIADAIIAALDKQEKINKILEEKGSKYCIGEITVELSLPPSISFSLSRK